MTYEEIYKEIGQTIPKSSMSYICKGVILPDSYFENQHDKLLARLIISRQKALETNNNKLAKRFEDIRQNAIKVVSSKTDINDKKINLAMLYKAEGSKYKSYRGLALGSSDPNILKIYIALLMKCYSKNISVFHVRVQRRSDQNPTEIQRYWARQLGFSEEVFYKSTPDNRTIGKPTTKKKLSGCLCCYL